MNVFCLESISPNFFLQAKSYRSIVLGKKICRPFAKFVLHSPNTVRQKKASQSVREKKPCAFVDEIDPWCEYDTNYYWNGPKLLTPQRLTRYQ